MASGRGLSEAQARDALVRCGRRLWQRRLVTGTSGNLSYRLNDGTLLATPSAVSLDDLTPGALVALDAQGTPRDGGTPTSELPLHLAAYRVRADINCVVHTHPTMCVVWSKTGGIFPRDTVGASETLRSCAWTPFYRNGSKELADVCATQFAQGVDVVMMERHGLSVVSRDLEDALNQTDLAEEAARIAYYWSLLEGVVH
ncbi:MAG TPA: class II aldolase/adducin family protein [Candidatus Aquilonibacter sp.]